MIIEELRLRFAELEEQVRGSTEKFCATFKVAGPKIRGRGTVDHGYRKLWKNGKWMFEHRLVLESKLGRSLEANEATHHINGDKLDNRPENLVALTPGEHARLHNINRSYVRKASSKAAPDHGGPKQLPAHLIRRDGGI